MEKKLDEKRIGKSDYLVGYVNDEVGRLITNSPEQVGAFIYENGKRGNIMITDAFNIALISTKKTFPNRCTYNDYLTKYLMPVILELHNGKKQIKYIPYVKNE